MRLSDFFNAIQRISLLRRKKDRIEDSDHALAARGEIITAQECYLLSLNFYWEFYPARSES